jgi:hypothetical protein
MDDGKIAEERKAIAKELFPKNEIPPLTEEAFRKQLLSALDNIVSELAAIRREIHEIDFPDTTY